MCSMTVRDDFLFLAGDPALDFVNTEIIREGRQVDLLAGPHSLERWLVAAKLVPPSAAPEVTPSVLAGAKQIRAALRDIAGSLASGRNLRPASVAVLDAELRRAPGVLALRLHEGRFSLTYEPGARQAGDPRFLIARAAASFLASADPARIRRCQGTNCILFFHDGTKSATRRWCSMAACGNRMKASLHYRRKRERA
jgi:predicted RNA-binding Zn ribbon-like protein